MRVRRRIAALILGASSLAVIGPQASADPPLPSVIAADVYGYGVVGVQPGKPATYKRYTSSIGHAPSWAPDGVHVAVLGGGSLESSATIYIMDRTGHSVDSFPLRPSWQPGSKNIVSADALDWSPDGKELAYQCSEGGPKYGDGGSGGICVYNIDEDEHRRVFTDTETVKAHIGFPRLDWSPDGTRLVFVAAASRPCEEGLCGSSELAIVQTLGTNNTPQLITQHAALSPDWSPDGKEIVYWDNFSADGEPTGVVVMGVPGASGIGQSGTVRQIVDLDHSGWSRNAGGGEEGPPSGPADPAWSPDGQKIAFLTSSDGAVGGGPDWNHPPDIFTVDAKTGNNLEQSTKTDLIEKALDWGPGKPGCDITGTPGKDTLKGTAAGEVICGQGGNDTLKGLGGDDRILGGAGNDVILGGKGKDTLRGEDGSDTLTGEEAKDTFEGGDGKDALKARDGVKNEKVDGGPGQDKCIADRNDDRKKCESP